ncbi:hypothetical protein H6802_03520 [Candidatus Nomurabacteria bacterium]|uniref:Uncharacterized protein n=1 Tax=candidate division WWE3 bacterium TaxID=2053526 RepID=A0A955E060_UNCKA|nr:hypothetical protein [candidate division WWE3 bacterium]MCB9823998.1 hypothetical protein [Candidatus Nomurabacteria bacterium]MCB9827031.1 hypothetical protein [Candidatus Nomurabacteria bacterium]MCB9827939.1 hypothetical protein [Candidatus Nomurabacteria bacterium]HXK52817.1 hypothetical protein [bacterium]
MKDLTKREERKKYENGNLLGGAYNFALTSFLFIGAMYFIYYSLSEAKVYYLLSPLLIYFSGKLIRKKYASRTIQRKYIGEFAILLFSYLCLAYFLYVLGIDAKIINLLPKSLFIQSAAAFIGIIILSVIGSSKLYYRFKHIMLFILTILFVALQQYTHEMNLFFESNPQIINYIGGIPILYLISVIFGLSDIYDLHIKQKVTPAHNLE